MIDYFGARQDAAQKRNSEYIGRRNHENRQLQMDVISGDYDRKVTRNRFKNRKWNDEDRLTAINMYLNGKDLRDIASFIDRKEESIFIELQPMIVKNALGYKDKALIKVKINNSMRAKPYLETLMPLMEAKNLKFTEWLEALNLNNEAFYTMTGSPKAKKVDVPIGTAIKAAQCLHHPVDKLFDFYFK